MKKTTLSLALALLMLLGWSLPQTANAQTTRRVNNNPAAAAPFTTIQAAVDAATAGDIILVEGSATAYAGFTLNKQLTITGPGYFFSTSTPQNPVQQANQLEASINSIVTFAAGSSGSIVQGLSCYASNFCIISGNSLSNITIRRCYHTFFGGSNSVFISGTNISNCVITQNMFTPGGATVNINGSGSASNLIISNNYLWPGLGLNNCSATVINNTVSSIGFGVNTNLILQNNIMPGNGTGNINFDLGAVSSLNSITLQNNIICSATASITQGGTTTPVTGNGNLLGFTMTNVTYGGGGNGSIAGYTLDGQYQLKPGSPAIGAGIGGVNCGMFGGGTPYRLSGIPPVPVITNVSSSGSGTSTTPLNVTISVTGNQ